MTTRGFVGYKLGNRIKGWFHFSNSHYRSLGFKVLQKYESLNNEQLKKFFLEQLILGKRSSYNGENIIWTIDWKKDSIMMEENSNFIHQGRFCMYGYVFNLNNDELELYRGGFKKPYIKNEKDNLAVKNTTNERFYTHKVGVVTRHNIESTKHLFQDWFDISSENKKTPYPENNYLKVVKLS